MLDILLDRDVAQAVSSGMVVRPLLPQSPSHKHDYVVNSVRIVRYEYGRRTLEHDCQDTRATLDYTV